nr:MAG TPA: hypothetical protein [Caudoviricetes sp.]
MPAGIICFTNTVIGYLISSNRYAKITPLDFSGRYPPNFKPS